MIRFPDPSRRAVIGGAAAVAAALTARHADAAGPALLSPTAMRADVGLLRRAYETLHPGLLRYTSPAASAARFEALAAAASRPMTLPHFYLTLSRFLATVRCGHSYANFYNQSKAVRGALFEAPDRLPFAFLWLGERMVVTADPMGIGIARGSEIAAIDGRPAGAILAGLMAVARADGHNDAKRRRLMSMQGEDRYESFDVFFSLMFGGKTRYRLSVVDPDGRRRAATVEAISLAERRAHMGAAADASGDKALWTIERRGDAALLTMPNWAVYDSKWDWKGWLDAAIDRLVLDKVPRLVVDLRGNEGGEDCGNLLVSRLIGKPVPSERVRRLVRYRRVPSDLLPHLDTWDHSWDDWKDAARPYDARFDELVGPDWGTTIIEPRGTRYTGKVEVLIGPQNSSATYQFADLVQRERLATLIGEPTGGNRRGINGGCFYFLRLPGTGLEMDLPLIGLFPTSPQPDQGVTPDVLLPVTREQIAGGIDRQLERALAGA
ncbi:S41 family peptidase [uncultured Sphingomonas sp.]|uniref:S41 family peptidase n=1 Tax=uncultured Sphingomonas sp. TaxID=158754 RepID=UPI0035CA7283